MAPSVSRLQDVLRNWYARLPVVVQNARRLVRQTERCAEAFRQGELVYPFRGSSCLRPDATPHIRSLWEPHLSIELVSWEWPSDPIYQETGGRGSALSCREIGLLKAVEY